MLNSIRCAYNIYWQKALARQETCRGGRGNSNLCALFGDKPRLALFRFPALIRTYIDSPRENFRRVLSMTPRSEVDDVDATGSTALSWAVRYYDYDCAQKLLICGSNPSHRDFRGRTPLHIAAESDDVALLNLLLSAKPDVNSMDNKGHTALHLASRSLEGTRLMDSLISHGAGVQCEDNGGQRPLHYSVGHDLPANVQLLLEKGADINATAFNGLNALMIGVSYNSHQALKLLLREKALEYNRKDFDGFSVLEFAAIFGDLETIRMLQSSPRIQTVDLDGSRALRYAKWRRDDKEGYPLVAFRNPDKDPQLRNSAFKALWNSIAEAQQLDIEDDSETGFIEGEETDDDEDDEEQSTEKDEQNDHDDDEYDNEEDDDDDDDDDKSSELWADAPESQDGYTT